jgi:hypothetical protein
MINGRGKSDSAIVAERPTNRAGRLAAESEERRAETTGNAAQQSTRRAQNREACPRRWIAYDKWQARERRRSSPRSCITSAWDCYIAVTARKGAGGDTIVVAAEGLRASCGSGGQYGLTIGPQKKFPSLDGSSNVTATLTTMAAERSRDRSARYRTNWRTARRQLIR